MELVKKGRSGLTALWVRPAGPLKGSCRMTFLGDGLTGRRRAAGGGYIEMRFKYAFRSPLFASKTRLSRQLGGRVALALLSPPPPSCGIPQSPPLWPWHPLDTHPPWHLSALTVIFTHRQVKGRFAVIGLRYTPSHLLYTFHTSSTYIFT